MFSLYVLIKKNSRKWIKQQKWYICDIVRWMLELADSVYISCILCILCTVLSTAFQSTKISQPKHFTPTLKVDLADAAAIFFLGFLFLHPISVQWSSIFIENPLSDRLELKHFFLPFVGAACAALRRNGMGMDKLDIWKGKKGKKNCIIKNYLQDTEIYIYGIFSFAFFWSFLRWNFFFFGSSRGFFFVGIFVRGCKMGKNGGSLGISINLESIIYDGIWGLAESLLEPFYLLWVLLALPWNYWRMKFFFFSSRIFLICFRLNLEHVLLCRRRILNLWCWVSFSIWIS